jgi:hypothetical protein
VAAQSTIDSSTEGVRAVEMQDADLLPADDDPVWIPHAVDVQSALRPFKSLRIEAVRLLVSPLFRILEKPENLFFPRKFSPSLLLSLFSKSVYLVIQASDSNRYASKRCVFSCRHFFESLKT